MSAWTVEEVRHSLAAARRYRTFLNRALLSETANRVRLELIKAQVCKHIDELQELLMAEREAEEERHAAG